MLLALDDLAMLEAEGSGAGAHQRVGWFFWSGPSCLFW